MNHRPFLLRLILPFLAMIVLIVGVSGAIIYYGGQRNVRMEQIHYLDRLVDLVRAGIPADGEQLSEQQAQRLRDLGHMLETRITLIAPEGQVLFDNYQDPRAMENHNWRPEVAEARASGVGSIVRRSDTISEHAVYVARRLDPHLPGGMIVRLSFPERLWAKGGAPIGAIVLGGTLSAAMVVAWLAIALQRQWIRPIHRLADAAGRMAAGEWQTRVEPAGADDVRFLGNRFNVMADHAGRQMADLHHQRADLQALVDSLPDPVLLSDRVGCIAVLNAPAANLLHLTPAQALGKRVVTVVNEESILAVMDDVQRDAAPIVREIRLYRSAQRITYQAVATRARAGGVLLVLRNVSALADAMQMKTDFVANASHELRTPIAAIKIAFETLEDVYREDPEQSQRCIAIIAGHLKRLEMMLSDLLDLSRVESAEIQPRIAPVSPASMISHLDAAMGSTARSKGVELRFESGGDAGSAPFNGDERLLNLILKNLIENSIKFTPTGGRVTVRFERDERDASVRISVADTGIGIPPEHQQRVFERFYQVDPARRGSAGRGTGLGLAIVKHAVHALGGEVTLQSAPRAGTTVVCTLPQLPLDGA